MICRKSFSILLASAIIFLALTVPTLLLTNNAASAGRLPAPTAIVYLPLVMKNFTAPADVSLKNIAYNPNSLTIHASSTVRWTNNESFTQHTVTSGTCTSTGCTPSGTFDSSPPPSPALSPGQTFQFTFNSTGSFPYFCRIHLQFMTGTITVTP